MKKILLLGFVLSSSNANAWCFLVPTPITYGSNTNGENTGITAEAQRVNPTIDDLSDKRVLLANIFSMQHYDVTLNFANAPSRIISFNRGEGMGLTSDRRGYFQVRATALDANATIDPNTDAWAPGNYVEESTFAYARRVINGQQGAYLRLSVVGMSALPEVPTSAEITNLWDSYGGDCTSANYQSCPLHYNHPNEVYAEAAVAPFTTDGFVNLPIVEDCQILNNCAPDHRNLTVDWSVSIIH